jgi:CubicO group peptidase (beta-lactamase class C family)
MDKLISERHPKLPSLISIVFTGFLGLFPFEAAISAPDCPVNFRNADSRHLRNTAQPAKTPYVFQSGEPLGDVTYKVKNDTFTLEDYLDKFCVTGLLVLKEDRIVYQRYFQGRKETDALLSASMSKSLLAMLYGIAVAEGKIALNDKVSAILPEFKDSAFGPATVEDLLRMSSGVALMNSHAEDSDSDNRATNPMLSPRQNVLEFLRDKRGGAAEPGKLFAYNGAQTAMLAALLSARVGGSLTPYLESRLWQPMGAETAGYWIKNWNGEEGAQGQYYATLRDYAKLGYLMMNKGRIGETQVIPADWIAKMTELRLDKAQPKTTPPYYGLHVWIPQAANGRSFFWGTNGQFIFVDPIARVVIVHTANSPHTTYHGIDHVFPLRNAIVSHLNIAR